MHSRSENAGRKLCLALADHQLLSWMGVRPILQLIYHTLIDQGLLRIYWSLDLRLFDVIACQCVAAFPPSRRSVVSTHPNLMSSAACMWQTHEMMKLILTSPTLRVLDARL